MMVRAKGKHTAKQTNSFKMQADTWLLLFWAQFISAQNGRKQIIIRNREDKIKDNRTEQQIKGIEQNRAACMHRSMRYERTNSRLAHFCQVKTEPSTKCIYMLGSVRLADHNNQVNSNSLAAFILSHFSV